MTRLNCRLCANKAEIHDHCLKCWNNVAKSEAIAALKLVRDKIGYKNNIFSGFFKACLNLCYIQQKKSKGRKMAKHLRYQYDSAWYEGEKRHAQTVMDELGITYQEGIPQSLGDQWWFYNCKNIPDELPSYLTEMDAKCFDRYIPKEKQEKTADDTLPEM